MEPILPPPFIPQTVAEFIFADEEGNLPDLLDLQEVDQIYNDYIRVMTCMHERLRSVYNTYVTRYFDEKLRKEHNLAPETQRLILPGEEGTDGECDYSNMFEVASK
jgi:hypothetical protein